jgi:hypothetical protein
MPLDRKWGTVLAVAGRPPADNDAVGRVVSLGRYRVAPVMHPVRPRPAKMPTGTPQDMQIGSGSGSGSRLAMRGSVGHLTVAPQRKLHLDTGCHVGIRPDLIFGHETGMAAYVADTKYKITADGYGREADYYQILAYAAALGVSGMPAQVERQMQSLADEVRARAANEAPLSAGDPARSSPQPAGITPASLPYRAPRPVLD